MAVTDYYGKIPPQKPGIKPANVRVSSLLNYDTSTAVSKTDPPKKKMLFLLLYIRERAWTTTHLHPDVPFNQLANSIYQYTRSKSFADKLGNRNLEIELDTIPRSFTYHNIFNTYAIFVHTSRFYYQPNYHDIKVNYTIWGDGVPDKKGSFIIEDPNRLVNMGYFQSFKGLLTEYLTNYDAQLKRLGPEIAKRIQQQL